MKRMMILGVVVAVVMSTVVLAGPPMNGPHYNLNIIGAPQDKEGGNFDNQNRHTIMVDLEDVSNIYMQQGADFAVIDGDGTDGTARFQLGPGRYEVYAVALGKPNKEVTITPEAIITGQTAEEVFYLTSITLEHEKKPRWERVTGMFLVDVTVTVGGVTTTYNNEWIFSIPTLVDYWWIYDNDGCKLTQVRFYKVESIPEEDVVD